MTRRLRPGVYEDMITAALEAEIKARREDGWRVDVHPADATSRPELLARRVYELLRRALEAIHGDDGAQAASKVALANRLVEALFEHGAMADDGGVTLPYCCLGRAHYRSHESERPMKVLWELERPMPGWLYQAGKVVAG